MLAKTMREKSFWHKKQSISQWTRFVVEEANEIKKAAQKKDWDELEQEFKASGKKIKTRNATQSAEGDRNGLWTTVIATAVFCE